MDATKSVLLDGSGAVLLASPNLNRPKLSRVTEKAVVLIEHTETGLGDSLQLAVTNTGAAAQRILFAHVTEATRLKEATAISLLEAESPLLAGITNSEMRRLKLLTDQAKNLLWVTAGDLLNGKTPQMGLAAGLSHALMLEQPSLRLMVYDTDKRAEADCAAQNLLQILTSSQMTGSDLEYVENDGTVHMARFVPDTKINAIFQLAQDTSEVVNTTVSKMTGQPIQLATVHPGQFDSIQSISAPLSRHQKVWPRMTSRCRSRQLVSMPGTCTCSPAKPIRPGPRAPLNFPASSIYSIYLLSKRNLY